MYPLLETIRITKNGAENLHYHQERMDAAFAELFAKMNPFRLEGICRNLKAPKHQLLKCRILYGPEDYQIDISDYQLKQLRTLKLLVADELDYHLKFADRSILSELKNKNSDCDDILIVKNGLITDTSYANIAFLRNGKWITPATPLLKGTQRQLLLDKQKVSEGNIAPNELHQFERFRIFNAMLPFHHQKSWSVENIRW